MATTQTERRQHVRYGAKLPAHVARLPLLEPTGTGETVDVGDGGVCVTVPPRFHVGDVVMVRIGDEELSLEHRALVVGLRQDGKDCVLNLAFGSLRDDEVGRIHDLLERDRG